MNITEQFFKMSDGQEVFVRSYTPPQPRYHLHILHGMAEHSARYDEFARFLAAQQYLVTMHDHRGHGKTAERNGQLGYFAKKNGATRIVKDVQEVIAQLSRSTNGKKTILFGHSMGSFIARRFIQLHSDMIRSAIICGTGSATPLHKIGNVLATALATLQGGNVPSKLLNELSFGSFNRQFKPTQTELDWLCSDATEVEKYIQDPHCGFVPTNQFFADVTELLLTISKTEEIERIRKDLPLLFIAGSDDPVGNNAKGVYKVAQQLADVGVANIEVYIFERMRHEILKEENKQHVYDVIRRWLEKYE